jgi:hypothetical protein
MTNNKQQTEINAVEYIDKVNQFAKENNTGKPKQQTAVEWLEKQTRKPEWHSLKRGDIFEQAKEMEKEQIEQAKLDAKEIIIIKHTEHNGGNK